MKRSLYDRLFVSYIPLALITIRLLKHLKVKVHPYTINETLQNHPDYLSVLAISDSLAQWHVNSIVFRTTPEKMLLIAPPFVTRVKRRTGSFILVEKITTGQVQYVADNNSTRVITQSHEDFFKIWDNTVLVAEPNERSGDKNFTTVARKAWLNSIKIPLLFSLLLVLSLAAGIALGSIAANAHQTAGYSLLLLFKLAGIAVASLLLFYEIDKTNPLLQKICTSGLKTNCSAVLGSKQSKLFSWLSWSEAGFFYFSGGFMALLLASLTGVNMVYLVTLLNLLALPYTIFSVVYQGLVVKQWCALCLSVQALLVLEAGAGLLFGFSLHVTAGILLPATLCFMLPAVTWLLMKPFIVEAQENRKIKRAFTRLKFNDEIFSALLGNARAITQNPEGLGIMLGDPAARNSIIKVCNPYCGPCAAAHPHIDALLENIPGIKVQIIFAGSMHPADKKTKPISHLLALNTNEQNIRKALDDWYLPKHKDYDAFAQTHPVEQESLHQEAQVQAMSIWCKENSIMHTPTFFVNGKELPDVYHISDLKYFLAE